MQAEQVAPFCWPAVHGTVAIVALVLGLAIFVFGLFSGARANKVRMVFTVCLATAVGWFAMPLAIRAARTLRLMGTETGVVILVTAMMFVVAVLATSIYEIVTVTLSDIGKASRK